MQGHIRTGHAGPGPEKGPQAQRHRGRKVLHKVAETSRLLSHLVDRDGPSSPPTVVGVGLVGVGVPGGGEGGEGAGGTGTPPGDDSLWDKLVFDDLSLLKDRHGRNACTL